MTELPVTHCLILERQGSVLRIWFNRIEARNALSVEMIEELESVLDAVRDDRGIRSIILRGKGGAFCAGADIKGFQSDLRKGNGKDVARGNRAFGDLLIKLNEQPQVVIILVEGAAIGGGLGVACCGDVTLVTRDARFRLSETSLGFPPAQIAAFVTERVGLTQARRLMLTGARFTGEQAVTLGVAHAVAEDGDDLETQCRAVLDQVAQCAPGANAATKNIVFESLRRPRAAALDLAAASFAGCLLSEEGREGVAAFIEKRTAGWAVEPGEDPAN